MNKHEFALRTQQDLQRLLGDGYEVPEWDSVRRKYVTWGEFSYPVVSPCLAIHKGDEDNVFIYLPDGDYGICSQYEVNFNLPQRFQCPHNVGALRECANAMGWKKETEA